MKIQNAKHNDRTQNTKTCHWVNPKRRHKPPNANTSSKETMGGLQWCHSKTFYYFV